MTFGKWYRNLGFITRIDLEFLSEGHQVQIKYKNIKYPDRDVCHSISASVKNLETAPGCHHQIPQSRVLVEYSVSIRTVEYCVATKNLSKNAEDPLKVKQNKNECILPLDRRTKQISPGSLGGKERGFHMLGRDSFTLVC